MCSPSKRAYGIILVTTAVRDEGIQIFSGLLDLATPMDKVTGRTNNLNVFWIAEAIWADCFKAISVQARKWRQDRDYSLGMRLLWLTKNLSCLLVFACIEAGVSFSKDEDSYDGFIICLPKWQAFQEKQEIQIFMWNRFLKLCVYIYWGIIDVQ